MRLKSEIWVKAYVRRCAAAGAFAAIVRRGDSDAGAVFLRVNRLDGTCQLYGPAPAGLSEAAEDRSWVLLTRAALPDAEADARLSREVDFDGDLWIVEVEDRRGQHFLTPGVEIADDRTWRREASR